MSERDSRYADAVKVFATYHSYDDTGATKTRVDANGLDSGAPLKREANTLYLLTTGSSEVRGYEYVMNVTDHITNLANLAVQDPTKWWVLADANPGLGYPLDWSAGDIVTLPE